MPRRARIAFSGAAFGLVAMALTWVAAHEIPALRRVDVNVLLGFLALRRPVLYTPAHVLVSLCDPFPYALLVLVPVTIALLRRRPRTAAAVIVLVLGANLATEVLKPLLAGPRDAVPGGGALGVVLSHATWPSGHSTAAMALALSMVLAVPARARPVVSALMAVLVLGVVYSVLALGMHYPSDVLGGFEVASTWALVVVGGLWTYEAHRPKLAAARRTGTRFSVGEALGPALMCVLAGVAFGVAVTVMRPHEVAAYASSHPAFVAGAVTIAALSFACAAGLNLMLRLGALSGSGPAPTAARPHPPRRSLHG